MTSEQTTTVKKSVLKERQRIADETLKLVREWGYRNEVRTAWAALFPENDPKLAFPLRDSNGNTLDDVGRSY